MDVIDMANLRARLEDEEGALLLIFFPSRLKVKKRAAVMLEAIAKLASVGD